MESNQQHIHSFEHVVVPATCTQRGYTLHRCACGYEHKDQFTPQSQHTFVLVEEIEPGCTVAGACKTRCSQCGQEQVTPIPAVGHKWGEWSIQQYATCTESGVQMRPCTRCDARDERPIPASGHKIVSEKRNGVEEYYCANCGMPMEKPVVVPVQPPVAAPVQPPKAAPAQPPKAAPVQPQQTAPAKPKKNGWKKWLIAIVAVILLLAAAVSAIYIIKPDFYYDFIDEHPFFDILGDNEYDDEDDDDDDDDKKKGKDKETTPSTGSTEGTKGTENTATQNNPTVPGNNQNTTVDVPVGTELTEPEVIFDFGLYGELQFNATIHNGTQTTAMEIAVIDKGDGTGVYYMAQGTNAAVVERTLNGLVGYLKEGTANFTQDTTVSQDELQGTLSSIEQVAGVFADYVTLYNGAVYRKINPSVNCPTGPVFAYEVLQNGQVKGEICIDKATGLMVYIKNFENGAIMNVQSFSTNVQLPAYK